MTSFIKSKPLSNQKILITAGPTREKIDDVRYISNHSTGKMGFALAEVACLLGGAVTLVTGPVNLLTPNQAIDRINVNTADEMYYETQNLASEQDIMIFTAAVADYTPKIKYEGKLKKETNHIDNIELTETIDILKTIASNKLPHQIIVGFALESDNLELNAKKKLISKNADYIIANYANQENSGFGGDNNTITIYGKNNISKNYPALSKFDCAIVILYNIISHFYN